MDSLWIAYCRITYYKKKNSKEAPGNTSSEEAVSEEMTPGNTSSEEAVSEEMTSENASSKEAVSEEKNYDYRFQDSDKNNDEEFIKGILKSQSRARGKDDIDIVCKIEVRRKRETGIKGEFLEIEVWDCQIYEDDKNKRKEIPLGVITTDTNSLGKNIQEIALMGSGITKSNFRTITKIIEVNYPLIKPDSGNWKGVQHKSREQALLESILYFGSLYKEYLGKNNKSRIKKPLFLIPVKEFSELYNDMEISEYLNIKDYKKYLKDNGYIKTNQNRYDYTDTEIGKCIAFEIKNIETGELEKKIMILQRQSEIFYG